ncbi:YqfO family protein, partial [Flavihumibacter sp. CACIAM 22H1]|uniref:Nif3-like dinuclear metal center hexameric protein n=1 Tax=Flavihumibacter sp. CACIAM 22H1 TaxID=1812911 RepID=UPI000B028404
MKISAVTELLEKLAPLALQESYDNAGLITGNPDWDCTGITIALDATEEVVLEAKAKGHNLIVAHHPIVFSGLKKFSGSGYVEKALVTAIRQDIALYAIHTNLDNIIAGVNGKMADVLGLKNRSVLLPRPGLLKKLVCFVPTAQAEMLSEALFSAGAGSIGAYSECAFRLEGVGSFKAGAGTKPFVGEIGRRHQEKESRVEVIFPGFLETGVLAALHANHPYEEPAYDLYIL